MEIKIDEDEQTKVLSDSQPSTNEQEQIVKLQNANLLIKLNEKEDGTIDISLGPLAKPIPITTAGRTSLRESFSSQKGISLQIPPSFMHYVHNEISIKELNGV